MNRTDRNAVARFILLEFKFIFSFGLFLSPLHLNRRACLLWATGFRPRLVCNPTADNDVWRLSLTCTRKIRPFFRRVILYFGTMAEGAMHIYDVRNRADGGRPFSHEAGIVSWGRNLRPQ